MVLVAIFACPMDLAASAQLADTGASTASLGVLEGDLRQCAGIEDSLRRLQCFDKLVKALPLGAVGEAAGSLVETVPTYRIFDSGEDLSGIEFDPDVSYWLAFDDQNPLDDSTTATAALFASTEGSLSAVTLVFRCKSGETNIYINWRDYLGSDSPTITLRMDQQPAVKVVWSISSDNNSSFFRRSRGRKVKGQPYWASTQEFGLALVNSERFVAQTTPYNENPKTAIFNLRGSHEALRSVRSLCGW